MKITTIDFKINHLEREIQELKTMLRKIKAQRKVRKFSSLAGVLKNKTDLSLEEIQSFKYKQKEF